MWWCENVIKTHGKKFKEAEKVFFRSYLEALAHKCFNTRRTAACTPQLCPCATPASAGSHAFPKHQHLHLQQPKNSPVQQKHSYCNAKPQLQTPPCTGNAPHPMRCRCFPRVCCTYPCDPRKLKLQHASWCLCCATPSSKHILQQPRYQLRDFNHAFKNSNKPGWSPADNSSAQDLQLATFTKQKSFPVKWFIKVLGIICMIKWISWKNVLSQSLQS